METKRIILVAYEVVGSYKNLSDIPVTYLPYVSDILASYEEAEKHIGEIKHPGHYSIRKTYIVQ